MVCNKYMDIGGHPCVTVIMKISKCQSDNRTASIYCRLELEYDLFSVESKWVNLQEHYYETSQRVFDEMCFMFTTNIQLLLSS